MKGLVSTIAIAISLICCFQQACQGTKSINWGTSTTSLNKTIEDFKPIFFGTAVNSRNLEDSLGSLKSYLDSENVKMLDALIKQKKFTDKSLRENQLVIMDAFVFVTTEVAFKQGYKENIKDYPKLIDDKIKKNVEALKNIEDILKNHVVRNELRENYKPNATIDFCKTGMSHLQYLDFILNYVKILSAQCFHIRNVTSVPTQYSGISENWEYTLNNIVKQYQNFKKFFKEQVMIDASLELWNCDCHDYSDPDIIGRINSTEPIQTPSLNNYADDKDYYVSTHVVEANFAYNRVITGVKFEERDKTLFIRIQQGKLLPNGIVDGNSLEWLEIDDHAGMIYYSENGLIASRKNRERVMLDGILEIDLTEVTVPEGRVLVGIGFEKRSEKRVGLKLASVKCDYNRGELMSDKKFHHSNKTATKKVDLTYHPASSGKESVPISNSNHFINLTITEVVGNIIEVHFPSIDTGSLKTTPSVPLSGASLHVLTLNTTVHFLSLKLATYDMRPHILVESEE